MYKNIEDKRCIMCGLKIKGLKNKRYCSNICSEKVMKGVSEYGRWAGNYKGRLLVKKP